MVVVLGNVTSKLETHFPHPKLSLGEEFNIKSFQPMGLNPVPNIFCGSSLGLILNNIVSILVVLVGVTYNFLGWYGLDPLKKVSLSPPYLQIT